mgnify:CR=1 FL=1
MNITATITPDCKHLNLVINAAQGNVDISITSGTNSGSTSVNVPVSGSTNILLYLPTVVGTGDGVFRISGTDSNGDDAWAGVVGSCSLDCCIAKKVDTLLECGCGCAKCSDALTHAERVHLLISGIRSDLSFIESNNANNTALFVNAEAKYNKALDLCSDDCGCGC